MTSRPSSCSRTRPDTSSETTLLDADDLEMLLGHCLSAITGVRWLRERTIDDWVMQAAVMEREKQTVDEVLFRMGGKACDRGGDAELDV